MAITKKEDLTLEDVRKMMLDDYQLACFSREMSLLGRKEVLMGKAKFGIFGDGKELPQIAMSKVFRKGDFRSGYYRDQTFMLAKELITAKEYFAGLYGHNNLEKDPQSGGRQMGGHFSTQSLNEDGTWKDLTLQYNSSPDMSPTAGQMPRLLGLAQASKIYKNNKNLHQKNNFSNQGKEIAFGTIGDASTSEGLFWETMNAAGVMQVPMLMSVWDDGWGISVAKKYQTVKESISEALAGFEKKGDSNGFKIFTVNAWNYPELLATYEKAENYCRENHAPVLVHVEECTQPQGHSTSGSHERYKTAEQLAWSEEYDNITQFKKFLILEGAATEDELDEIRKEAKKAVRKEQKEAWAEYRSEIDGELKTASELIKSLASESENRVFLEKIATDLEATFNPIRKDVLVHSKKALRMVRTENLPAKQKLITWLANQKTLNNDRISSHLYSQSEQRVGNIQGVAPEYADSPEMVDGRLILRDNFEVLFNKYPEILTFGEDTGGIGGVNQSMEGMQEKFGELRVSDTGIREATIVGQGIGMALRGLRPIAEIQYLDYIYYALQTLRDDLSTIHFRTKGRQKAPLIVRTRGHRLEGIWHSGSPMAALIHSLRGMNICVPRNMTQAAGMYNTLLESDEPALVIERLNGYRTKEALPSNLGEYKIELGKAEIIRQGKDITVVSYGSTLVLCEEAAKLLAEAEISIELIDVQTLLPFDKEHLIAQSVEKTNKVIFIDEDVEGGATAYMLQQFLDVQKGFYHLDSEPKTLFSKPHLPAYTSDGDYFSKPNIEDIFEAIYTIFNEYNPSKYPNQY